MISDDDLRDVAPKETLLAPTAEHVHSGVPIPKAARVRTFSPDNWEEFIEEWATSLTRLYKKVRRFGGSGDLGVDIAGFVDDSGFQGTWENYQCKRYDHSLRPSDVWIEIAKIIYYSHRGEYVPPRRHYFVSSQGVGTSLEKLLNDPTKLKANARLNWEKYCKAGITETCEVPLEGELLSYFEDFDFGRFSSKSLLELIEGHTSTRYHAVRFGGGLPPRPPTGIPPLVPTSEESRYIRQLLDVYGDHLGISIATSDVLNIHESLSKDFLRQRERFYHAEALRNFARDTVPEGTFEALKDEIYHGVVDICEGHHSSGFNRMRATVSHAAQIAATSNPLAPATKAQDRQGMCHQLANDDRLVWLPKV